MFGSIESLAIVIGRELAPYIIALADAVGFVAEKFMSAPTIVKQLTALFLIMGTAVSALVAALLTIHLAMPILAALKVEILSLSLATLGWWAALFAGVVIIALIAQDLYTFINGGDSLIGRLIDSLKSLFVTLQVEFYKAIDYMKAVMATLGSVFKFLWDGYWNVVSSIASSLPGIIASVFPENSFIYKRLMGLISLIQAFGTIAGTVFGAMQFFVNQFTTHALNPLADMISNGLVYALETLSTILGTVFGAMGFYVDQFSTHVISPLISKFDSLGQLLSRVGGFLSGGLGSMLSNLSTSIGLAGGAVGSGNNLSSAVTVNVAGSNASAGQFGKAAQQGTEKGLRGQADAASRNVPKVKR